MNDKSSLARMPTLSDVAREAGVSKIAVSVVLNGARSQTRVSEATRARILETAARLNYHPNASARSLSLGRTNAIGILVGAIPVATSPMREVYGASIIQGIADACGNREYDLVLFTRPSQLDKPFDLARLRSKRTDGVIVVAPLTESRFVETLVEMGVRAVAISYPAPDNALLQWSSVDVDNYHGARIAVNHLIALGHRRIAHLAGTPDVYSAIARRQGYIDALQDAGLPLSPELLVEGRKWRTPGCKDGSYGGQKAWEDTERLLALEHPPTALFAANDVMAVQVLKGALENGVDVPGRLSVVGFDDREIASLMSPPLTTIRQPMVQIGEDAANLLMDQIEQETRSPQEPVRPVTRLLTPELIVRKSTGPVPR